MNKMYVYPYKMGSGSARNLASVMECKRIKPSGTSNYIPRNSHVVINYGSSNVNFNQSATKVLNLPSKVAAVSNKLKAFGMFADADIKTPEFTTDIAVARTWEGKVVARTKLQGSGGEGIVMYSSGSEIDPSINFKLFTKYIKKTKEYRVHVFKKPNGTYTADRIQVKKLSRSTTSVSMMTHEIRNHTNGWVFSTNYDTHPDFWNENIKTEAIKAVKAAGLDFGAVDIIWNKIKGIYVLEINTAPGLEGDTLETYKSNFNLYK